jgi:hypothetical protein
MDYAICNTNSSATSSQEHKPMLFHGDTSNSAGVDEAFQNHSKLCELVGIPEAIPAPVPWISSLKQRSLSLAALNFYNRQYSIPVLG